VQLHVHENYLYLKRQFKNKTSVKGICYDITPGVQKCGRALALRDQILEYAQTCFSHIVLYVDAGS